MITNIAFFKVHTEAHSKVYNILRKQAISIPIHFNASCLAIAILGF